MRILSRSLFYFLPTMSLMYCYGSIFHLRQLRDSQRRLKEEHRKILGNEHRQKHQQSQQAAGNIFLWPEFSIFTFNLSIFLDRIFKYRTEFYSIQVRSCLHRDRAPLTVVRSVYPTATTTWRRRRTSWRRRLSWETFRPLWRQNYFSKTWSRRRPGQRKPKSMPWWKM